ncbi:MAG: FixH family protein [Nitrospirae bacterium]|nr:FixH family protein [Nitrospirota bacterium]
MIIVCVVAVAAAVVPIIIGSASFDGVVTDKYYEKGLDWDKLQKDKLASGWSVEFKNNKFKVSDKSILISVFDAAGKPINGASISLKISRPATNAFDKTYSAKAVDSYSGRYKSEISFPLYGYWDIQLQVLKDDRNIVFDNRIFAEKEE